MSEIKKSQEHLKSQVQIRTATEADVPFIFNSWLKSYYASPIVKNILPAIYFDSQHKLIEALLKRSTVLVACTATDSTQLLGYIVCENNQGVDVLHYAYVKHSFRGLGITKLLAQEAKLADSGFYTHRTHTAAKIFDAKANSFIFNPYLAYICT